MTLCPLEVMAFLLAPVAMYSQFGALSGINMTEDKLMQSTTRNKAKQGSFPFQQNKTKHLFFTLLSGSYFYKVITSLNTEENCSKIQ